MNFKAGFTLVELLVSVAVLSVLVSMAVPNFQSVVSDTRQASYYNKVASALRYARSEAIKRSAAVSICARASDNSCGDDWANGMLIFLDATNNGIPLVYDGTDTTLRTVRVSSAKISLRASALVLANGTPAVATVVRFNSRGQPNWINGTMVLCDDRGAKEARALVMTGSGISRRAYRTSTSNDVVVDARGVAVTCS